QLARLFGTHPDEDLARLVGRQQLHDVRRVVGVHLLEQGGGLGLRQRAQDPRGIGRRQALEDLGDLLVGQPLEEDRHLARLELWHEIRPVGRPDAVGKSPYAVALALTDEALDLAEQLGRRFAGHGVAPNTWGVTGWTVAAA